MNHRTIDKYDPQVDAGEREPAWRLVVTDLGGVPELVCRSKRIAYVDTAQHKLHGDRALAHVLAHVDLHPHGLGEFTEDEERQADYLARVRLDIRMGEEREQVA